MTPPPPPPAACFQCLSWVNYWHQRPTTQTGCRYIASDDDATSRHQQSNCGGGSIPPSVAAAKCTPHNSKYNKKNFTRWAQRWLLLMMIMHEWHNKKDFMFSCVCDSVTVTTSWTEYFSACVSFSRKQKQRQPVMTTATMTNTSTPTMYQLGQNVPWVGMPNQ